MAKIIVSSRYMRNSPKRSATDLVKYMGTRKGVERVVQGIDNATATVRQQRLVQDIIKFDSAAREYGEYNDYENSPTKSNASGFIDAFIERNTVWGKPEKVRKMSVDIGRGYVVADCTRSPGTLQKAAHQR